MTNKLTINLKKLSIVAVAAMTLALMAMFSSTASAGHNGASVDYETVECGETTFSAGIVDPNETHKVDNMELVVSVKGTTQNVTIPTDGSVEEITVGPFTEDTVIQWRVFGGGERDYDQPLWNGYGDPSFKTDINNYGAANGWDWLTAGPSDPNPFVSWNKVAAEGCPLPVEDTGTVVETTEASEEDQVEAPVGGVNAGTGNTATTVKVAALLIGSLAGLAYGVVRFTKFGA